MALFQNEAEILSFSSALLMLLLSAHNALAPSLEFKSDEDLVFFPKAFLPSSKDCISDADQIAVATLHSFRLCNLFSLLVEDLEFWVKPRNTT
jgi:hypothetical protein